MWLARGLKHNAVVCVEGCSLLCFHIYVLWAREVCDNVSLESDSLSVSGGGFVEVAILQGVIYCREREFIMVGESG
jgi:hypothetical protein